MKSNSLDRIEKCWGWTTQHFHSPQCAVFVLETVQNGYCSLHYHVHRMNRFVVHSGRIAVDEYYGPKVTVTELSAGQFHDVPSMVAHRFRVLEPGILTEIYTADRGGEVTCDDIVRLEPGGRGEISKKLSEST